MKRRQLFEPIPLEQVISPIAYINQHGEQAPDYTTVVNHLQAGKVAYAITFEGMLIPQAWIVTLNQGMRRAGDHSAVKQAFRKWATFRQEYKHYSADNWDRLTGIRPIILR